MRKNEINVAARQVRSAPDATIRSSLWMRYLAESEANEGGEYTTGVLAKPEAEQWPTFSREVFSKLYGMEIIDLPPEERPQGVEWMEKLHGLAADLPEWQTLGRRAAADPWLCGMASGGLLVELGKVYEPPLDDPQAAQDELDFVREIMAEGKKTSPKHLRQMARLTGELREAKAGADAATKAIDANPKAIRDAMRGVATRTLAAAEELDQAMSGLGYGAGFGGGQGFHAGVSMQVKAPRAELVEVLRANAKLRRIAMLAGRLRAQAIAKQMTKARPGAEELCDVSPSGDLQRVVPSELLNLAEPDTEALFFRRMMEKSLLTYELRGREKRAQGPIVICIDESGSMSGRRDEWAKATALAVCEIAARQKRPFAVVHYDTRVTRTDLVPDPRSLSLEALQGFVNHFSGGGTQIAVALQKAHGIITHHDVETKAKIDLRKADVILVSDGEDYSEAANQQALKRLHDDGIAVFGVAIESSFSDSMARAMTGVVELKAADMLGACSKLDQIFSI